MDLVLRGEAVEEELIRFTARHHDQRCRAEGERPAEASYVPNVRAHNARRERDLAWQWLRFHQRQLDSRRRTFALLDAHDRREIERYERLLGIDHDEGLEPRDA